MHVLLRYTRDSPASIGITKRRHGSSSVCVATNWSVSQFLKHANDVAMFKRSAPPTSTNRYIAALVSAMGGTSTHRRCHHRCSVDHTYQSKYTIVGVPLGIMTMPDTFESTAVSYTHLTLPTKRIV